MARPSTRREINRQKRRSAILTIAYSSFAERGYGSTTMSQIAADLGGSKATLWSYFPSKESLFAEVVEEATLAVRRQLTGFLDPDDEPEAALRRFCTEFLSKVSSPGAMALHRMVIGETSRFPELGKIYFERAALRTQQLLADYIEELQRRGKLKQAPALPAARHLISLCLSGTYQLVLTGNLPGIPDDVVRAEVDAAVGVFMAAYGARYA